MVTKQTLTPAEQKFVLHWGEMGSKWGVNRTVAQIHSLLHITEEPLNAEVISETLGIARSNTSNSIKELMGWGIVKSVPVLGDRREHFVSEKDIWTLFWTVTEERKKRELDPVRDILKTCLTEMDEDNTQKNSYSQKRIQDLYQFVDATTSFYDKICRLPTETLVKIMAAQNITDSLKKLFQK
ncbi:MAG: MarR family transcriptional regulator [Vampirovibrio sp.]|nr:MarR family transcriptional regulator [Vampirovibrio sp.]